jgi:hypothetical protein
VIAMRAVATLFLALVINSFASSASAETHCQCVCHYTPFGRECRRVCQYIPPRVYAPAPDYKAQPYYTPPPKHAPAPAQVSFQFDPTVIVLLGAAALALLLLGSARGSAEGDIARVHRETNALNKQAHEYEHATNSINAYVSAQERAAFEQGRRAADEEWRRMTGE